MHLSRLFIDHIDIHINMHSIDSPSFITIDNRPSGQDDGLVTWRPCRVLGWNPTVEKIFFNVHLFRVPGRWTGSVQMKSIMICVRVNWCIERER